MAYWPSVVTATPAHSGIGASLSYRSALWLAPGTLVRVPLGAREVLGVVWDCPAQPPEGLSEAQTRPVASVLDLPALNASWRQLVAFAGRYYQRGAGEVALAALPPQLRELDTTQLARRLKRQAKAANAPPSGDPAPCAAPEGPALSTEQAQVLAALQSAAAPALLFGATGSGKTEVYLRATRQMLDQPGIGGFPTQALVMVPEINLTPQLEARFRERFEPQFGAGAVVCLHSGMTPAQRLASWLAAHTGQARIVLGTRMAVFASLPGLRLIVVDEEHDPSYKSQDGARYSARDLAVYRAKVETDALAALPNAAAAPRCQVLLGS
ncbi:MAG: DEAD/DEAH box helicase, partial [Hydrogenophaga sp.]